MTKHLSRTKSTQHSELITVNPIARSKGFKDENIRIIAPTAVDEEVACRMEERLAEGDHRKFNKKDQELIKRIQLSYHRKRRGEVLEPEDFTVNENELREFRGIPPKDTLRYLIYRYKYQKFPELKITQSYPPCLQIEPTSICNFRCIMCYQIDETFSRKSSGYMGHMSLDLFKTIIDQVHGHVEAVTLASRGEPLLNPNIIQMLDYCRGKFLALKLNTNGSLLNERLIHGILQSDLQTLVFSIDSANKSQYEKIRVNGNFEKLLTNLELFRTIRERDYKDSRITVRISGVKLNEGQQIDNMSDKWRRFADVIAFTNYTPWQDSYNNPVNDLKSPCTELWRRMFVWWDGKVNPCDFDYKSIMSHWSIVNSSLTVEDIWTSAQYNELRNRHITMDRGSLEPCRRCVMT